MKKLIFLLTIILSTFSCKKEEEPSTLSLDYIASFATEVQPISITIDKTRGYVFVANYSHPKIQKYGMNGVLLKLLKSVVDFETFDKGKYLMYKPIDITIDNNHNLYVLVQPFTAKKDGKELVKDICVLAFDKNDVFQNEIDFSQPANERAPTSIAYSDNFLFVTNGQTLNKISTETQEVIDIPLPVNPANKTTWSDIHTTDMEINSEGLIYFTGQALFGPDSLGCHITSFNSQTNERVTSYSKYKTRAQYSMQNNPGLSINSNGNIYLPTFYERSIEIYNKNMDLILQKDIKPDVGVNTRPIDLAIYDNYIYVVDNLESFIHIFKEN